MNACHRALFTIAGLIHLGCALAEGTMRPDPPLPREIIDLGVLVTEDLPERTWGKALLRQQNFERQNHFDVVRWDFADGQVSGSNAYYTLFNHGGPHVDAPNHVGLEGGIDAYPVEAFSGPLRVFDVSTYPVGRSVPASVFQDQGLEAGDVVFIHTAYAPPSNDTDLPAIIALTPEAARYLAGIPVRAFGTDALSAASWPAPPAEGETALARELPIHHAFLSRGIPIFEQLSGLHRLLGRERLYFTGAPLNIQGGDGMMVRPLVFVY